MVKMSEFRYLGSLILKHGYCEKEIHCKIFMDNKRLFTGKLNSELKKRIIVSGLEHSTVYCRDVDVDAGR